MDSNTLGKALKKLNKLCKKKHTVGVYAADRLPARFSKPAAFIIHTENANISIGHWIAIYFPEVGKPYFFDSYGIPPYVDSHIKFLYRHSKSFYTNKKCYQAIDSTVCGGYCLLFLAYKLGILKIPLCINENSFEKNDLYIGEATNQLLNALENV
jgi:hypothetical protein